MGFWYVPAGIAALIAIYPYIRCFFKRLTCAHKIQKLCSKKEYKTYPTHPLWFLGNKHAKNSDLYIETANEVFAIKLFGMHRRLSVLILKENGEYYIRNFIGMASYGGSVHFSVDGRPRPMPVYDFRHDYRDEWETKTPRRVLLINPVSMEFRLQPNHGDEATVGAGDIVNGMEIDSLPRLLGDLERAM